MPHNDDLLASKRAIATEQEEARALENDYLVLTIEACQRLIACIEMMTADQNCHEIDDMLEHMIEGIQASNPS